MKEDRAAGWCIGSDGGTISGASVHLVTGPRTGVPYSAVKTSYLMRRRREYDVCNTGVFSVPFVFSAKVFP